ncbi:MAG: type II secretion system minor pseudopilin GspK, partial [Pseudomonas sp.]|uniref:type II secretion system minor pseudopilin GspK n=1 Tax=Pseudomonas sp. TaxID=306 RepID=UPI003BB5D129
MPGQRGVALITVLLVVAIATVVTAGMIARQQLSIRSSSNQLSARQAWHYALGGEALAQAILARDLKQGGKQSPPVDHLREAWARKQAPFDVDEGRISLQIEDLAGRFNLNSLVVNREVIPQARKRFERLLRNLQIDPQYAARLVDWLDEGQEPSGASGAEDNQYLLLQPPYRTGNRRLQDVSELRLLLELSERDYRRLQPYVSALPADTKLNVNTASALVLSTLSDTLSLQQAQELVQARGAEGYRTPAEFTAQPALTAAGG